MTLCSDAAWSAWALNAGNRFDFNGNHLVSLSVSGRQSSDIVQPTQRLRSEPPNEPGATMHKNRRGKSRTSSAQFNAYVDFSRVVGIGLKAATYAVNFHVARPVALTTWPMN